ncbi:predicted protein [Arabidopsis lyrata subsp. lyrata]|uniref:Predicted protein n=1 Tax=Arabidopsis lyrata subsp. lyrata TaxID=81972 RepID=D7LJG0_ARALL|nr:predicted protein [Arabidopsis lyrata subsp. lyrata]
MARVRMKGGDRVYESTEGCREGASNPDPIEASADAAVPREAPTDAVSPTEAPMDAELEVPSVP